MKTILKPLPLYQLNQIAQRGMLVCRKNLHRTPIGVIYELVNGRFEAVPYDHMGIKRFDDPHAAQKHIEQCKGI